MTDSLPNVLIIGPYHANMGGISMHVRRLVAMLDGRFRFSYVDEGHGRYPQVFNLRSGNLTRYFRLLRHADVVHVQSGHFLLRAFHITIAKVLLRKRVIVTVHRNPAVERFRGLTRRLLGQCDHVIMVSREGYEMMNTGRDGQFMLMPAFLPPVMADEQPLPEQVCRWIAQSRRDASSCLLVSNAWNLVLNQGEDLYGLDLCIDAAVRLREMGYGHFCFIFVVASNTGQQDLMERYKRTLSDHNLSGSFLIWEQPLSFVRLLEAADIMLRTTNTDGDAISVREALYLGKTVIASDVVARPSGVLLFKNRSADSLVQCILSSQNGNHACEQSEQCDYKAIYTNLYTG